MNKKQKIKNYKIAVLLSMLVDELDEVNASDKAKDIIKDARSLQSKLEPVLDRIFTIKKVYKGTYLQDLSLKIDTVIRRNYQDV